MKDMDSLLITGGRVIDPANGVDTDMDLLLRDGDVAALAAPGKLRGETKRVLSAKGCIVSPGLIDLHVHLREPGQAHKETIATGTAAAAAGGFTSVCAMPNTVPVNDSAEITRWMQAPERGAVVNVFPIAAATMGSMGEALTDFAALNKAGAVVERDIALARETKGHIHVAHLSTREALQAVRDAKQAGVNVTCEVTPHHFTLIDENIGEFNPRYKMNPPLRSTADRDALIEGILDGTIDAIATDHAPHAYHEKQVEFDRAAFGIIGLETALAIAVTVLHHHFKLPLWRIVELLSSNPARIFGLSGRGSLSQGSHADITIFDPRKKWTFDTFQSKSKSRNTPYDGWTFTGRTIVTVVNGKIVYEG